jgi:hypothetical protein
MRPEVAFGFEILDYGGTPVLRVLLSRETWQAKVRDGAIRGYPEIRGCLESVKAASVID